MTNHIPFNSPSLVGNEMSYIKDAITRGQLSGDGYYTKACHARFEELTGSVKALLTHSCTAALEMAALLCELRPGDEVIMPSFTFVSTANAVVLTGATPVFVDIDARTLNIDPEEVATAITDRTKAIFAVHYAGVPADMDPLTKLAKEYNLVLVEDAAQALGSTYKGRPTGSLGDLAAFSFHETKNIISGEGGALTITAEHLIQRAEIIREKGTDRSQFLRGQVDKYSWVDIGSSYLPGELIAAFLYAQLEQESKIHRRRTELFQIYANELTKTAEIAGARVPYIPDYAQHNGHMFYLLMQDLEAREALSAKLKAQNITAPFHYVPLHSSIGGKRFGRTHGQLPNTNATSDSLIRLPMYFELGERVEIVIEAIKASL